jgi:two-component sensor histidine kinase/CheY-like chemotaxis protein
MKIVIADDIAINRKLLRAMLEAEGHITLEAADGVEALQILSREKVDAVMSDLLMPRMDGYRLCHEIRTIERLRDLPIVIYTSTYTEAGDEKLALDLGADKYLKKPAPVATILATLKEAIATPRARPQPDALRQVEVLKEYSDRLVAKLEQKNVELEERLRLLLVAEAKLRAAGRELKTANTNLQLKVAELSKSNGEKSVLLQEVHHRVNNNLQVIAGLLRMQAEACVDTQLAAALRISLHRIESMALIHAQLYGSPDLRQVDFAEYSRRLAENMFLSYGVDRDRIGLSVKMASLTLSVDQAIPAGLILSELIANAIKYAFPGQRRGSIRIEGGRIEGGRVEGGEQGERIELALRDDGVGISEDKLGQLTTQKRGFSRGLGIVSILCRQLDASLEQTHGAGEMRTGAGFRISFLAASKRAGCGR